MTVIPRRLLSYLGANRFLWFRDRLNEIIVTTPVVRRGPNFLKAAKLFGSFDRNR